MECRFEDETIWLTQSLLAELFQKDVRTINEHLVNIFEEGELSREATIRKFRIVRLEGARKASPWTTSGSGTRPGKVSLITSTSSSLNRIVSLYIEFAELQALDRKPMAMRNWVEKLDEFLRISGRKLLDHAGQISAETARTRAEREYDRYRALADSQPRPVDADFERAAKAVQKSPRPRKPKS